MSYNAFETSDYSGHPIELYRFVLGGEIWLFTSADHEVAVGDETYQPIFIKRGGFSKGSDTRKSTMEIEVAASNPLALLFRTGWLTGVMVVTVSRFHHGDSEYLPLWKGRVTSCKWAGSVATLSSDSAFTMFQRAGLRRVYQAGCPHVLFGNMCLVDPAPFIFTTTISLFNAQHLSISGLSAYATNWFAGGMIRRGDEYRLIIWNSNNDVAMVDAFSETNVGDQVRLWPGCDRTFNTCLTKFNNLDNFGGLPFLPGKNPFSGDALV